MADQMQWEKSLRHNKYRHERRNPSFSSSLLDEIYRSIDEGDESIREEEKEEFDFYRETMKKKQSTSFRERINTTKVHKKQEEDQKISNFTRSSLIDNWIEEKMSEKIVRRKSIQDFTSKYLQKNQNLGNGGSNSIISNSTSSSSDSCCGSGFSSSEAESIYSSRSRPKSIRTSVSVPPKMISTSVSKKSNMFEFHEEEKKINVLQEKPKIGNGFIKTKSRALKIYGDLKKVKQPISPGGKLANFINSLFTAGVPKKPKFSSHSSINGGGCSSDHLQDSSSETKSKSTCSSASSFSRSCLSKTPLSSSSSTRIKRSVKFYPVSVIVDEDCKPIGHKYLYGDQESSLMAISTKSSSPLMNMNEELKIQIMEKNRRVEEVARDLLKGYQRNKTDYEMRDVDLNIEDDEEEEEDDDAASCSSSDLFELDHLRTMGGIERYREELPVYETTHFHTNYAIANGLIL